MRFSRRRLLRFVPLVLAAACGGRSAARGLDPTATAAAPTPEPTPTSPPPPPPPPSGVVTINAVGDIMLARRLTTLMDQNGADYPYVPVRGLLADADLVIANMEGTFTDRGVQQVKEYTFRTPPADAQGLKAAGIGLVSLGNNHAMDYGDVGLADTMAALDAAGVLYAGAGPDEAAARRPVTLQLNGLRIAFLSYCAVTEVIFAGPSTPGVANANAADMAFDVAQARTGADVVIVALHAGIEYTDPPSAQQHELAQAAIDAGAALVLGAHPHVMQGWQRYGNGLVVYSMGNFVFDLDSDDLATLGPRSFQTAVFRIVLTRDGVTSIETRPLFIDPGQDRPLPATPEQAQAIADRLNHLNGH